MVVVGDRISMEATGILLLILASLCWPLLPWAHSSSNVLFDPREKSKTKGLLEEYIIGRPNNYYRLKIPPKIWYGFTCVSKEKALIVNCANIPHSPDESKIYPINNLPIPYKWDA